MRITNNIIVQSQLDGLQSNLTALNKAQTQATTGKRLTQASDDPGAAATIMSSASSLRAIQQYKTTVSRASDRIAAEDTTLQQLQDLLTRAKQIATQQGSDTSSAETRAAAAAEVGGLIQSAVQLGNTKFGNEYLFGGDAATTAPFATSGSGGAVTYSSTDPTGQRNVEIGDGQTMAISHDGTQVFVNTGALAALQNLQNALAANDGDGIRTSADSLDTSFDGVQTIVGDVGARGNRLDMTSSNLDAFEGTVTNLKSDLEDIDYEAAITDLMSRQNAYQAAMLATTKVMSLTLTDYLR
jgi:flagellar hook-associated protein 3 FlgL